MAFMLEARIVVVSDFLRGFIKKRCQCNDSLPKYKGFVNLRWVFVKVRRVCQGMKGLSV